MIHGTADTGPISPSALVLAWDGVIRDMAGDTRVTAGDIHITTGDILAGATEVTILPTTEDTTTDGMMGIIMGEDTIIPLLIHITAITAGAVEPHTATGHPVRDTALMVPGPRIPRKRIRLQVPMEGPVEQARPVLLQLLPAAIQVQAV